MSTESDGPAVEFRERQVRMLELVAGYAGFRAVGIGLEHGILQHMAARGDGIETSDMAAVTGLDPSFLEVWCRLAHAVGVLDSTGDAYRLDGSVASLLTDRDSPAYLGGLFRAFHQSETFDPFSDRLPTGEPTWWDEFSSEFIGAVAETTRPAYLRLVPEGLARVPGLIQALDGPAHVVDLACGTGFGLATLANAYPAVRLVGVDGDAYSLRVAASYLTEAELDNRVDLVQQTLEGLDYEDSFDLAVINMSMHEARDMDRVADNVLGALRPGGYFVISDFPYPETSTGLRDLAGQVMAGIQIFEVQIGDQLLPTRRYLELLDAHGFEGVDSFDIAPTHAVIFGRKPG